MINVFNKKTMQFKPAKKYLLGLMASGCCVTFSAVASDDGTSEHTIEVVNILGSKEDLRNLTGSGSLVDSESIAKFDATDVNNLVSEVPGVYVRYEDGYGLRPNIGIRGVTSDRSQKITLMEDGILISPAPYTAPAAYYFPNVNRMDTVEVLKGPAAIQAGPHTIGGTLNMITRPVPNEKSALISATYGTDNYQKIRGFYGDSGEQWGGWIDVLSYGADGFKELDSGADTGFKRNDINGKVQWKSDSLQEIKQRIVLKFGYADETSDETYLGLSDADFELTPNRRYAASQLDEFTSEHQQVHGIYSLEFSSGLEMFVRSYWNQFTRAWNKFDGFIPVGGNDPIAVQSILAHPDQFPEYYGLIRGDISSDTRLLDVTNNDREYGSYGLTVDGHVPLDWGSVEHYIEAGVRYHVDYVERNHSVKAYTMQNGEMLFDGNDGRTPKDINDAESHALAAFINDQISFDQWKVNVGVRVEQIDGEFDDALTNEKRERSQTLFTPGLGVLYTLNDQVNLLAGVYKGFSPAGPSSDESIDAEEALNYEYGFRFQDDALYADVIGFFSDYSNLIGRCRASDSGCNPGDEFNGGAVQVGGVEFTSGYAWLTEQGIRVPLDLVYTYTDSAYQTDFESGFSQWGNVSKGDQLPYLPQHQARLQAGLEVGDWTLDTAIKYVDTMLETPGSGELVEGRFIEAHTLVDMALAWQATDTLKVQLIGENLADKQVTVSRRPFGARPNPPRTVKASVTYAF